MHCAKTRFPKRVYCLHYDDNRDFDECCQIEFRFNQMVKPANERFRVAGICDGLVCLADDELCKAFNYIIWNPAIRKEVMLPLPVMTNDYKVVRFVAPQSTPAVAGVYSLATGSWRSLGSVVPHCQIHVAIPYAFIDGAIHCTVRKEAADDYCYFILTFDLGRESFREIMMPKGTEQHYKPKVSVSGDGKSLALFTGYRKDDIYYVDIWLMKEYCQEESGTKLITLGPQGPERWLQPHPLCFRKSGEVFLALIGFESRSLVSLDTQSQKFNNLGVRLILT
ncbi:F-box/kelch-repeat protein At3g06240-like [Argentina anserina]|uniref:F-box/kelch-repeat protein At3g06240-like n=1 Tax=Argentina anserina TaxID=57926 RepID=UPI0021761E9C|nr:F-box/kelch-repeat protein At3g06240-like [Potentilla anserina]